MKISYQPPEIYLEISAISAPTLTPAPKDHHYDDADSNLNWLRCLCWCQILDSTLVMVLLMRQDRREIMSPVLVFREWR